MKPIHAQLHWNGRAVLDDIQCVIQFHPPVVSSRLHAPSWSGEFDLPSGRAIQAGGPYELQLRDGRMGRILVQRSAVSGGQPVRVDFLGCGPMRGRGRG